MLKKFKNNVEAYLIILVSVLLFFLNSFGFKSILGIPIDETTLMTLVLAILAMVYYKLIEINTNSIHQKLENTNLKFDDLLTISKGKITAIEPKKEEHVWKNFVGDFYAINAPWKLEENMDIGYENIISEYIEEYSNSKINQLVYVFYEESNYSRALERFSNFAERIVKESIVVKEKIKVIILPGKSPEFSLFFGYKESFSNDDEKENISTRYTYSIIYINDKPFINKNGMPSWSLVSVDNSLNKVLENYSEQIVHGEGDLISLEDFLTNYKKNRYKNVKS